MTLLIHPLVVNALDRSCEIEPSAMAASEFWNYDLFTRKPGPAYNDYGVFQGTDLDLATFLFALQGRGAVINIPTYKATRQVRVREGQQLKSKENRNGVLLNVQSNQDFFSFSIKIMDMNVIQENKIGDYRTFMLTNFDGEWYDGWRVIEFDPTLSENRFITENNLWTGNKIIFKNFIHPNRWTSFFGHHYAISKIMIERLTEEAKFLNAEVKRLRAAGIEFPGDQGPETYEYPVKGESKSVSFPKFEAKIYIPETEISGEYPETDKSQTELVRIYKKMKRLRSLKRDLMFNVRAAEYAYFKNQVAVPAWIKGQVWEDGFKIPGKRVEWKRLKLFQPAVGERAISILKRETTKATQVGIDY
jgi:hypothetical protein